MKTGLSLSQLASEIERQHKSKKDYLADTRKLRFRPAADVGDEPAAGVVLDGINGGMRLRQTAHAQMATTLGIPKPYYDKMLSEAPDLLANNANHWLDANPLKRMVRTLDGEVRAVLSESYRPLDNYDLATAVLPKLQSLEAVVLSSQITESRMYLKAVTERITGQVKVGDVLQAGVVVSNSEVGDGALRIESLDYRLACLNGMVSEVAVRKAHLGRSAGRGTDAVEDAREFFRDETRRADDRAFFLKVQDATAAMFDRKRFDLRLDTYRQAAGLELKAKDAPAVVEVVGKKYALNEGERESVLGHLIAGGDLSAWGLANAVTRAAQDVESFDRSYELEKVGGDIVHLPANTFKV